MDVNRCSRWDALPSQCGGGAGGGSDGAGERDRMLKIYCVSHIDSFASAILATPPLHPRRCGGFKDNLTLFSDV